MIEIATVYEYGEDNAIAIDLLKLWAHQISVYAPESRVTIYTASGLPGHLADHIRRKIDCQIIRQHPRPDLDLNIGLKLASYAMHPRPFVGIDADAILFAPIADMEPVIPGDVCMALHGSIPGHTTHLTYDLPQGGVQLWQRPHAIDIPRAILLPKPDQCPGIEQPILLAAHRAGLYSLGLLAPEWNVWGGHDIVLKQHDGCRLSASFRDDGRPANIVHYWAESKSQLIVSMDALHAATGFRD